MSTSYVDIYNRANVVINSPKMTRAALDSPITYYRIMYPFLQSAFGQLNEPRELLEYLSYRKEPEYIIEDFIGDGIERSFLLSFDANKESPENVYFIIKVDNENFNEGEDFEYKISTNEIIFTDAPISGAKIMIEYYYTGEILGTNAPDKWEVVLTEHSIQMLAMIIVKNWLEKNKNRELTIQANISPKDYQRFSPANALKENRELYKLDYNNMYTRQQGLSWNKRFLDASGRGSNNFLAIVRAK